MPAFDPSTAIVTAEDADLGRLAVKGYEVGTTNWRSIAADLLVNGWTASGGANILLIQRSGYIVTMFARGLTGNGTSTQFITALPVGFQPRQTTGFAWYSTGTGGALAGGVGNISGATCTSSSSSAIMNFSFSWPTDDAWPTSLPGTAA